MKTQEWNSAGLHTEGSTPDLCLGNSKSYNLNFNDV